MSAIIPVGTLEGAKSRLGESLDPEERRDLVTGLLAQTIAAVAATPGIAETLVVTPDDEVCRLAQTHGASTVAQSGGGLNAGLREARARALSNGSEAILVLPVDLPFVSPAALDPLLSTLEDPARPVVAIVSDRHHRGTNALLVAPPEAIDFAFGGDSRAAHVEAARAAGARVVELDGPLALDLDTPDDLLRVEAAAGRPANAR
ncbi:MAG: 2-phospho-L-lactate guanylyltransferase [Chloroflexota bacterium]